MRSRTWLCIFAPMLGLLLLLGCAPAPAGEGEGESGSGETSPGDTQTGGTETGETGVELMCGGDMLTVAGQSLAIDHVQFSGVGLGGGQFADLAEIHLEGDVILVLQFLQFTNCGFPGLGIMGDVTFMGSYRS